MRTSRWMAALLATILLATLSPAWVAEALPATRQSGTLSMPTKLAQNEKVAVIAAFNPARKGRVVTLELLRGTRWVAAAKAKQTAAGKVKFPLVGVKTGRFRYRAVAAQFGPLPAVKTRPRDVVVTAEQVTVAPTVEPLTAAEAGAVSGYDPDTGALTFGTRAPASVDQIKPGDFVVAPPGKHTPTGLLRKAVKVSDTKNGAAVVRTADADLPDVVKSVPQDRSRIAMVNTANEVLRLADGVTQVRAGNRTAARSTTASTAPVTAAGVVTAPPLEFQVEKEIPLDAEEKQVLTVSGEFSMAPTADISLDTDFGWDGWHPEIEVHSYQFGAGVEVDHKLKAELTRNLFTPVEKEIDLGKVRGHLTGAIGVVPVYVAMDIQLILTFEASGKIVLSAEVAHQGRAVAGVKSETGSTSPDFYVSDLPVPTLNPSFSGTGEAKSFFGAKASTMLYDAAGPEVKAGLEYTLSISGKVDNEGPGLDCEATIKPVLEAAITLSDDLKKLVGFEVEHGLYESDFAPWYGYECPQPEIATEELPDGEVGTPYAATLEVADGRQGAWKLTDGSLPDGLQLTTAGTITGTPTKAVEGQQFSVHFTDTGGWGATKELVLTINQASADPDNPDNPDDPDNPGDPDNPDDPVQVGPIELSSEVRSVAVGATHTCAIATTPDGYSGLYCWGANDRGQLGLGRTDSTPQLPALVSYPDQPSYWNWVSAGDGYTCAGVSGNGRTYCWGANEFGQLGVGDTQDRLLPTEVKVPYVGPEQGNDYDIRSFGEVVPGSRHTCGLATQGRLLFCWGANDRGQLGVGDLQDRTTPTLVDKTQWIRVTLGAQHTCAQLLNTGGITCFGDNTHGQLGGGYTPAQYPYVTTPKYVSGLRSGNGSLTSGPQHTCAVNASEQRVCWGVARDAGIDQDGDLYSPVIADPYTDWMFRAFSGTGGNCANRSVTEVWCWGENDRGQLGAGLPQDVWSGPVETAPAVTGMVSTNGKTVCSATIGTFGTPQGELWCWGDNKHGQIGGLERKVYATPTKLTP